MGLSQQQQRDKLRNALGVEITDTPIGDNTTIDLLLNQSWWEIADVFEFREKETSRDYNTVIGQAAYPVSGDSMGVQQVTIEDPNTFQRTPLKEITEYDYQSSLVDATSAQGRPTNYIRRGTDVILWPTPDDIYSIHEDYWKTLADIAVGGVTIPQAWHPLIWINAAFYGFLELGDVNRAYAFRKLSGLPSVTETKEPTKAKERGDTQFAAVQVIRPRYR